MLVSFFLVRTDEGARAESSLLELSRARRRKTEGQHQNQRTFLKTSFSYIPKGSKGEGMLISFAPPPLLILIKVRRYVVSQKSFLVLFYKIEQFLLYGIKIIWIVVLI
ncbi:hypothetical protein LJC45_05165 [Alistipes sp. OttesenSCG-928-B03]|nr:hypothetical protein [Alistipes sp. OttesenSCG-928-B03]